MAATRGDGGGYGGKTRASKPVRRALKKSAPTRKRYATGVKNAIAAPHINTARRAAQRTGSSSGSSRASSSSSIRNALKPKKSTVNKSGRGSW